MKEYTVGFGRLSVHVREVGTGAPVLLINGIGAHTGMWACMEQTLRGCRLIEFDAPGAGQSSIPRVPVSVGRVAAVAARILDTADVDRADVIGYSMGGIVAQQLAVDAPDRVRRIVLAATTCGLGAIPGDPRAMIGLAAALRQGSPEVYGRAIAGVAGDRPGRPEGWAQEMAAVRFRHPPTLRGYVGQLISLAGWNGLARLSEITHPTLVLSGDEDRLAPSANAMLLAFGLPDARVLIAPGEGHLFMMDQTSVIHRQIGGFLTAPDHRRSEAWRLGKRVTVTDIGAAMPSALRQAQPWGLTGVLIRRRWLQNQAAVV